MKEQLLARLRAVNDSHSSFDHAFNQAAFDVAAHCITEQGEPSVAFGGCMYRSHEGLACAIGHMISDEAYARHRTTHDSCRQLEGEIVCATPVGPILQVLEQSGLTLNAERIEFLRQLQYAHDDAAEDARYMMETLLGEPGDAEQFRSEFRKHMEDLAAEYKLVTTHPALR